MSINLESIPDAGLTIIRRGINPVIASAFAYEWLTRLDSQIEVRLQLEPTRSVLQVGMRLDHLAPELTATDRVYQEIGGPGAYDSLHINYQLPGGKQPFHKDIADPRTGAVIVHASPNGAFDYSIGATTAEEALADHKSIDLNFGDIVIHAKPWLFHRGRNAGHEPRITGVFSNHHDL